MRIGTVMLLVILALLPFFLCTSVKRAPESNLHKYYRENCDTLLKQLDVLANLIEENAGAGQIQKAFINSRYTYKYIEGITEYYFQGVVRRINGPALPDIKTEDGQAWPPHGFQVIEQWLFSGAEDSLHGFIQNEIRILQDDIRFTGSNFEAISISPNHVFDIIQHQLIRIATLGITGFDAPVSLLSIPETVPALKGTEAIAAFYFPADPTRSSRLAMCVEYLNANQDFSDFNRMAFLMNYLMPLSDSYRHPKGFDRQFDSLMTRPFSGTLKDLLQGRGFNPDFYATYASAASSPAKLALGRKLFSEPWLSRSDRISCASCHQPANYFSDGKERAANLAHGGSLLRNTPSLYYAALQSHQFYDMRSVSLEDQADQVMRSHDEFDLEASNVAEKLLRNKEYRSLIESAFGSKTISGFEVRNALAAFVRTLMPFSSAVDRYMQGDTLALTKEQLQGFNLFTGKAKCATCHFVPLYNGNIPPLFTKSESEIIGVPAKAEWKAATISPDSGRFKIHRMNELMFAFKTPTVRNVEKTSPYMHNGVYKTLEEVVEFYSKGGGIGIGIHLPSQTLPFDSLQLNAAEKKAIVSFMKGLTDNQ